LHDLPNKFNFDLDKYSSEYSEDKIAAIVWLLLLTIAFCVQLYFGIGSRSRNVSGKGQIALLSIFCLLNYVEATEPTTEEEKTLTTQLWSLAKSIEIINWILAIVVGLSGLIVVWIVFKLYKFTRCTYEMTRTLIDDIDLPTRRR